MSEAELAMNNQAQKVDQLQLQMRNLAGIITTADQSISSLRTEAAQNQAEAARQGIQQRTESLDALQRINQAINDQKAANTALERVMAQSWIQADTDGQRAQQAELAQGQARLRILQRQAAQLEAQSNQQQAGQVTAETEQAIQREAQINDLQKRRDAASAEYRRLEGEVDAAQTKLQELAGAVDLLRGQVRDAKNNYDEAQARAR